MNKKLVTQYIRNNVLSLKELSNSNPALCKYVKDNYESIEERFNIEILDDTITIRGKNNMKLYFKYYYGDTVNLTRLRKENIVMYNSISLLGAPEDVIKEMGFYVEYDSKISQDELIEELKVIANEKGIIRILDKRLDNKIRYEARKVNKTAREYVEDLGFLLDYRGRLTRND